MTIIVYVLVALNYTIIFIIFEKFGVYDKIEKLEYFATIVSISIFIIFNLIKCALLLYFLHVDFFILQLLKLGRSRQLRVAMYAFCLYLLFAQFLSIFWWIYPTVQALSFKECSREFMEFRPYMIYMFHFQYFVMIINIMYKLELVSGGTLASKCRIKIGD